MAQDFDNLSKRLWADHPQDLSRFVTGEDDVEIGEDINTEQHLVVARHTDITKWAQINGQTVILHVELQLRESTHRPMWARNAQYQGYLVGEYQVPVYSNVIYFHPRAGRDDPGGYAYKHEGYGHANHYKVIRLSEVEGQPILEQQAPGLLPFTPLMKPPEGMALEHWIQTCVDATLALPTDQETQGDLLCGLSLFGGIVYDPQLFKRLIPEAVMQESRYYQLLRQEFIAQGIEQGIEQGARQMSIESTLNILSERFPSADVNALKPVLEAIDDLNRLKTLNLNASITESFRAFQEGLET